MRDFISIMAVGTVLNVFEFDGCISFEICTIEYEKNIEIFQFVNARRLLILKTKN